MSGTRAQYDIEALQAIVAEDAGCAEFPALAEALRRVDRAAEARGVSERGLALAPARLAGRVSLGLALIDLGQIADARQELSRILDAVLEPHRSTTTPALEPEPEPMAAQAPAFAEGLGDAELEMAFEQAEAQADEMLSPNRMAEQVLLDHAPVDAELQAFELGQDSPFGTATMASLLERQGDHARAQAIRDSLSARAAKRATLGPAESENALAHDRSPAGSENTGTGSGRQSSRKTRMLATLEAWLQNIQRGAA